MGMGMVLATAEMLKNDNVNQTGETTGTNYNEAILVGLAKCEEIYLAASHRMEKHPQTGFWETKSSRCSTY
eukprot:266877-Ditylum_brightwellii.AAC.1